MEMIGHLQQDFFGYALDAGGNVCILLIFLGDFAVPLGMIALGMRRSSVELCVVAARRSKEIGETGTSLAP